MVDRPRAVVDTNILVRAVLRPGGASGQIFRAFRRGRFELVTSPLLLDELVRVLVGPSIGRVADIAEEDAVEIRANLEAEALVVAGSYQDVRVVPTDPTDDVLFATALEGRATYVVSGDKNDVRAVKAWKPYEVAIQVVGAPYFARHVLGLRPPVRATSPRGSGRRARVRRRS